MRAEDDGRRTRPRGDPTPAPRRRGPADVQSTCEDADASAARAREVCRRLADSYPDARCTLTHRSAFELLVATVLSAQTTDARVNRVTPALFARWPTPAALAGAPEDAIEAAVRPLGFQHRRGGQLKRLSQALVVEHAGRVPGERAALVALPGVGRKTAHVVLGDWFGIPALTVDTHVGRLARRLGWSARTDPRGVEADVVALLPGEDWTALSHRLIAHGRAVCRARGPECAHCVLRDLCPSARA